MGMSKNTVREALADLEKKQVLIRVIKLNAAHEVEFRTLTINDKCDFLMNAPVPELLDTPSAARAAYPLPEKHHTPAARASHNNKDKSLNSFTDNQTAEKHKEEISPGAQALLEESVKFAEWFADKMKPDSVTPTALDIHKWAEEYEKLVRIDGKTKQEIIAAVEFGRQDEFWSGNFYTPLKLRRKDKQGVMFIDVFLEKIKEKKPEKVVHTSNGYNPRG